VAIIASLHLGPELDQPTNAPTIDFVQWALRTFYERSCRCTHQRKGLLLGGRREPLWIQVSNPRREHPVAPKGRGSEVCSYSNVLLARHLDHANVHPARAPNQEVG